MSKMTPKRDYKTFKQPLKIGAVCPWEKNRYMINDIIRKKHLLYNDID